MIDRLAVVTRGRRTRRIRAVAAALATLLAIGSGCAKSYVVASFRSTTEPEAPTISSEVLGAAEWARVVALRAPHGCAPDAAPQLGGPGVALRSRAILSSRCEPWLSELERALGTRSTVVGWRDLARAERGGRTTAALDAGAEIVLAVTDLEVEPLLESAEGAAVRVVHATSRGAPAEGEPLAPDVEREVRRIVAARYRDGAVAGVRAAIEIVATPAAGGGPLWIYRARVADGLSGALESRMLLRGRATSWRPVAPTAAPGPTAPGPTVESDSSAEWGATGEAAKRAAPAVERPPADPVHARLVELAKALGADLIASIGAAAR